MKLGIQLESRMRDVDAATYGTVFSSKKHYNRAKNARARPTVQATQWRSMEAKSEIC